MFSHPRHSRRNGFTLIEMLIAVTLLGILLTTVQPTRAGVDEAHVDAAVSEVESALRYARDESLRTGESYAVYFDTTQDRIRVLRLDESTDPATPVFDVLHPLDRRPWDVALKQRLATRHVDLQESANWEAACLVPGVLVFRDGGTPSCAQPIETLLTGAVYQLSKNDIRREVRVDGLTGRVYAP